MVNRTTTASGTRPGPRELTDTERASDEAPVTLAILAAMRAGRPRARAQPAPKPSWVVRGRGKRRTGRNGGHPGGRA